MDAAQGSRRQSTPRIEAIDLNGDVLVYEGSSRAIITYRLLGHLPPPGSSFWEVDGQGKHVGMFSIGSCNVQTYISPGFSFRSQAECQMLNRAYQEVQFHTGRPANVALDADGSIWWARSLYIAQKNTFIVLGHLLPG